MYYLRFVFAITIIRGPTACFVIFEQIFSTFCRPTLEIQEGAVKTSIDESKDSTPRPNLSYVTFIIFVLFAREFTFGCHLFGVKHSCSPAQLDASYFLASSIQMYSPWTAMSSRHYNFERIFHDG